MSSSASDPESLLAHASSIRRLARALVHGVDPAADADDVEQQTWLAALRSSRGGTHEEPANLRGWLRTVARNVVRRFARDQAARQRREESTARSEALAPVDDAVAHAEMHGKVIAALVALVEPYRSTLIRRYLNDETPTQIAAHDGASVETVKTRLKRGLALLRERFAAQLREQDGGERDWRRALLPLVPLRPAAETLALSVHWKLLTAAFVALVAVATLVVTSTRGGAGDAGGAEPVGAARSAAEPAPTADLPLAAAERRPLEPPAAPEAATVAPPASSRVPRFRVTGVVRDPAGAPVADAWVWLSDARAAWTRDPTAWFGGMAAWPGAAAPTGFLELPRTRTDPAGRFEFTSADRVSWRVAAWHADLGAALSSECQFDRDQPAAAPLELTLRPLVGLRGRFVDERGAPVPEATLHLTVLGGSEALELDLPHPWQRRDDATFEVPPLPAQTFRGTASAFGFEGVPFEVDAVTPPRVHELDVVLRGDPARLRIGRIVVTNAIGPLADALLPNRRAWELDGAAGQPTTRVACAVVRFTSEPPPVGTRMPRDAERAGEVQLADGTYAVDRSSAPVERHLGLVVREVVVAVAEERPDAPAPDLLVDAALVPSQPVTGVLRVRVHGAEERRLDRAGASLWIVPYGGRSRGGLWMPVRPGTTPDELVVDHVPQGRVGVHYALPGVARVAGETDVAAGGEASLDLSLRSGTASIHGFLADERPGPLVRVGSVKLYERRDGRTLLPALEAADTVREHFFSFDSLGRGEYALLWRRAAGPAAALVSARDDPEPTVLAMEAGIRVTIAARFPTGARPDAMSLRILRADGTPEFDEIGTAGWDLASGSDRAVYVSPGRHLVEVFAEGAAPAVAAFDPQVATRVEVPLRRW